MRRGAAATTASMLLGAAVLAGCAGGGDARPSVVPSGVPSVSPSVAPPAPSSVPSFTKPSVGPSIAPSAAASAGVVGSAPPAGSVVTVEVPGSAYVRLDESPGGTVTKQGDALVVETIRDSYMSTRIGYDLPPGTFAPDTTFTRIDMKLCGSGTGDFWETYAPSGGDPLEQEVTQPADDGCWHFDGADDGDPYFESFVAGNSKMLIEKIVYTLTIG